VGEADAVGKASKSVLTREKILSAFDECLVRTGYAQTKLVDIAEAAGLATPHLRYYFKNKESILEFRYDRQINDFQKLVQGLPEGDATRWFTELARVVFGAGQRSKQALLILIEAHVLVARSQRMRTLKQAYDLEMLNAMEYQLKREGVPRSARNAKMLFHYLSGLMLNAALQSNVRREDFKALFLQLVTEVLQKQK